MLNKLLKGIKGIFGMRWSDSATRDNIGADTVSKDGISVDSVRFDLANCELRRRGQCERGWLRSDEIAHLLRFAPHQVSWNFDLTDIAAAREFYGNQCRENNGVMLSLEPISVHGKEALAGVFKYPATNIGNGLGSSIVGIIWIPFQNCNFQINVEAIESGTTGLREAVVMSQMGDEWPKPNADAEPVLVASADELFEKMRAARSVARELPSDHQKYDAQFPDHPLSKVRNRMNQIIATITFDDQLLNAKPFRLAG